MPVLHPHLPLSTVLSLVCHLSSHMEFALSLIHSSALLLKMDQIKERPWVNHSGCSEQKNDREQIAQVALNKRTTRAIRSQKNERFARKTDERIPNPAQCTYPASPVSSPVSPVSLNTEGGEVPDKSIYCLSYYCLPKNLRKLCRFVQVFYDAVKSKLTLLERWFLVA